MNRSKSGKAVCRGEGEGDGELGRVLVAGMKEEEEYSNCEDGTEEGDEDIEEEVIGEWVQGKGEYANEACLPLERESLLNRSAVRRTSLWDALDSDEGDDSLSEGGPTGLNPDAAFESPSPGQPPRANNVLAPGPGVYAGVAVVFLASYLVVNNFTAAIYAVARFALKAFLNLAMWISS